MDDSLIRRRDVEAAILADSYGRYCPPEPVDPYAWALSFVKDVPAVDAVEVVRCRECIDWITKNDKSGFGKCALMRSPHTDYLTKSNWFCADGQRREDGDV